MAGTPIEQLQLSVRANNALHRMGIHSVEELIETPIEYIAQQRNIGNKTLDEIKRIIADRKGVAQHTVEKVPVKIATAVFTDEQLSEMFQHSIDELGLSVRPYRTLQREGYHTIGQVAQLSDFDFTQFKGLGTKSITEIKESLGSWIQENIIFESDSLQDYVDSDMRILLKEIVADMEPIVHLYWKQLLEYIQVAGLIDQIQNSNRNDALKMVLLLPQIQDRMKNFWYSMSNQGVITHTEICDRFDRLNLTFQPTLLIDAALITGIIIVCRDIFLISRNTFLEAYDTICNPDDRAAQILQFRIQGDRLQDIGDIFELTRERVRQITFKLVCKFPLLFEDYFSEPYQYFYLHKVEFCKVFPEITEEGYEFLSIRYRRGKVALTNDSLAEYTGLWKDQLAEYLCQKQERDEKKTVSKTQMIMRVLISNSNNALSIDELMQEYDAYIRRKGYPVERLQINIRSMGNYLRNTKGIVFDRDNKVRYCDADPHVIWEKIDFTLYKNMVISSELIFRDYQDVMDELDIRDGYELFYVIKASLSIWDEKSFPIRCRRVPVLIMGEASETSQALKLLKEISPVTYLDYYQAYEERYGLRKETAQASPVIFNAVSAYYVDGRYIIDVPAIDERDIQFVLIALQEKPLWFVEDIEDLFDRVCKYTTHDAINAAAFRRIGYTLHTSYAYDSSYGTTLNLFDEVVFSKPIIDLNALDRRMVSLGMFGAALDRKKKSLEYVETAPRILMSWEKIKELYGLSVGEMREIQSMMSVFYKLPFFNGRSIWHKVEDLPIIQKLNGNDWMLTCIMRQQEAIASLSVSGGIILSLAGASLNLSKICEWFTSLYGKMPIKKLEKEINKTFGTRIPASKFAEKLKASGLWDKVVTDSMDMYIDSLVDAGLSDMDADNLFQEEFF